MKTLMLSMVLMTAVSCAGKHVSSSQTASVPTSKGMLRAYAEVLPYDTQADYVCAYSLGNEKALEAVENFTYIERRSVNPIDTLNAKFDFLVGKTASPERGGDGAVAYHYTSQGNYTPMGHGEFSHAVYRTNERFEPTEFDSHMVIRITERRVQVWADEENAIVMERLPDEEAASFCP